MIEKSKPRKSEKAHIPVTGMTCTTCAATIEKGLAETYGVEQARVNFASEKVSIEYDPTKVTLAKIKNTISRLGYGTATKKSIFAVGGMTCTSCVARVEEALSSVPGVISANVNLASEKATVEYIEGTELAALRRAVKEAGYDLGSEAETMEDVTATAQREIRRIRNQFIFAAVLGLVIMVLGFRPSFLGKPYLLWALATPVQFWAGWRFYRGAWGALRHRTADMNTLIAIGTSAAYFYSVVAVLFPGLFVARGLEPHVYFDTAAMATSSISVVTNSLRLRGFRPAKLAS